MFIYSLGFGLSFSWLWLFYLHGPLLNPLCALWGISPEILFRCFISAKCLALFTFSYILKVRSFRNNKPAMLASGLILTIGPLLTAILPLLAANYAVPVIAEFLAAASGIAAAFFYTAWMETISVKSLRQSSAMFGFATAIASLLTILSTLVPSPYWFLPLLVLLPSVSLLIMHRQTPDKFSLLNEYQRSDAIRLFPKKLIFLLGLIYINGGILLSIVSGEQAYAYIFYLAYLAYIVFCLIAGLTLYFYEDIDLRLIYKIILLLMAIGFLLFCFQDNTMTTIPFVLLQGGSALLNMYVWLVFPYFSRFSTKPAAVCAYGLFIILISLFIGHSAVSLLSMVLAGSHNTKNLAFIAGVISVLTVFLFPDKKETFAGWQSLFIPAPKIFSPTEQPSSRAAGNAPDSEGLPLTAQPQLILPIGLNTDESLLDNLPLSLREREILLLILKGRNSRFISESLNISSNTVKYHMRNIYGKLSVNNRQELISLFEDEQHAYNS